MAKLRLIQCGVGGFGKGWITNQTTKSDDFELVAIVDISPTTLAEAGDAAGIPAERRFSTLEAALDKVQADAVLTVTPPAVHVQHARLAFARGLHLMSEKPIAATLEEAREMIDLARRAGRQLVISQNYRFNPSMQTLKRLVCEEKPLGELGHLHLDFYIPADFTGSFRETMPHVLLVDMAIHHFDLIRTITGLNIRKVYAQTFHPAWSWYKHNPGLKVMMQLDGGVQASYSGDWSARGRNTDWNGDWRLQCSEGSVHYQKGKISLWRSSKGFKDDGVAQEIEAGPVPNVAQAATLKAFAQAIHSGKPAQISGDDNLWSFGAVMAGVQSATDGRPIDVAALIGH